MQDSLRCESEGGESKEKTFYTEKPRNSTLAVITT